MKASQQSVNSSLFLSWSFEEPQEGNIFLHSFMFGKKKILSRLRWSVSIKLIFAVKEFKFADIKGHDIHIGV
jgi:hypothetical protein